jgi:hypothetical protein
LYFRVGKRLRTGLRAVMAIAFTPDGRSILVGGAPARLEVYDLAGGGPRLAYDFGRGAVYAVAVAPDGLTAAVAADSGLTVLDL